MASSLAQRLRNFLAARGGEADLMEVCQAAFAAQPSAILARRLLESALPNELSFDDAKVIWLAPSTPSDNIESATFFVVDLETTGTRPGVSEILEFGGVYVRNGKVIGEEHALFRPRSRIPPFIQQLTGITDDMVEDADPFHQHAERLHALFNGVIPVAHNAEFDFGFLRAAFGSAGLSEVGDGRLCTIKLARRFAPGSKYNLDALAARLKVETSERHRALGDARVTAHVLIELLQRAKEEGVTSVAALYKSKAKRGRGAETRLQVGPDRVRAIPDAPGVYRFRDAQGEVIYVGKAKSLRKRLGSYFVGAHRGKVNRMLEQVRDFDYTVTGSELEALIEESREIRRRRPRFNMAMHSLQRYGYLRWERDDPFPVLRFSKEPGDALRYDAFGPFRLASGGRLELRALREAFPTRNCRGRLTPQASLSPCLEYQLGRCGAPCALLQTPEVYTSTLEQMRLFLRGDRTVLGNIRTEIALAAKREQFERAAVLRDRFRVLSSIAQAVRRDGHGAIAGDRLLVLPAAEEGLVRLYWIRPGAPMTTTRASVRTVDWPAVLSQLQNVPPAADQAALEEGRLAEQWLRRKPSAPFLRIAEYADSMQLAAALVPIVQNGEWRKYRTGAEESASPYLL